MLCVGFSAGQKYDVYIYKNLLMFVETQFFFFFHANVLFDCWCV